MSLLSFVSLFLSDCKTQSIEKATCFPDRSVVENIQDTEVRCITADEVILLEESESKRRFSVCNLKDNHFTAEQNYLVTGVVYETKPNERWPGSPFQVQEVKKK